MRPAVPAAALPAALALLAATLLTGCNQDQSHEVRIEVTGTGTATEVVAKLPSSNLKENKPGTTKTERKVALPWRTLAVTNNGPVSVRAVPAGNETLSCLIRSDQDELVKQTGRPSAPVECAGRVVDN